MKDEMDENQRRALEMMTGELRGSDGETFVPDPPPMTPGFKPHPPPFPPGWAEFLRKVESGEINFKTPWVVRHELEGAQKELTDTRIVLAAVAITLTAVIVVMWLGGR